MMGMKILQQDGQGQDHPPQQMLPSLMMMSQTFWTVWPMGLVAATPSKERH
jgi:hypothetical protein